MKANFTITLTYPVGYQGISNMQELGRTTSPSAYSLHAQHHAPRTTHRAPRTAHRAPRTTHHAVRRRSKLVITGFSTLARIESKFATSVRMSTYLVCYSINKFESIQTTTTDGKVRLSPTPLFLVFVFMSGVE
jgi:aminopeptidase N